MRKLFILLLFLSPLLLPFLISWQSYSCINSCDSSGCLACAPFMIPGIIISGLLFVSGITSSDAFNQDPLPFIFYIYNFLGWMTPIVISLIIAGLIYYFSSKKIVKNKHDFLE